MSMNLNEMYAAGFKGVRVTRDAFGVSGIDKKDANEARISIWNDRDFREAMRAEAAVRGIGGIGRGKMAPRGIGANGCASGYATTASPDPRYTNLNQMDPGCLRPADPSCVTMQAAACHADVLGWTTLGRTGFPIAAGTPAAPAAAVSAFIFPQTTNYYKPAFLFFEARDITNLEAQPGLLVGAKINLIPQLSSSGYQGAVVTSAFSVDTPLDVRKIGKFGANNNDRLELELGNIVNDQVHYFGIFWGDNIPCAA